MKVVIVKVDQSVDGIKLPVIPKGLDNFVIVCRTRAGKNGLKMSMQFHE